MVIVCGVLTGLNKGAFSGCSGLTSVTIGNSVTSIGNAVFSGCSGLTSIAIPDSMTKIGFGTFQNSGLVSITIPNSVTSIGGCVFSYCGRLARIDFQGTKEEWQNIDKDNTYSWSWKENTGEFVVYCTDGTISKSNA